MKSKRNFHQGGRKNERRPAPQPDRMERRIFSVLRDAGEKGMSSDEMKGALQIRRKQSGAFGSALYKLVAGGGLQKRGGRYFLKPPRKNTEATVIKVADRFGFVRPEGAEKDVFVPGKYLMGAMPGDRVNIRFQNSSGQLEEARVQSILDAPEYHFTGVFKKEPKGFFVYPDRRSKNPVPVAERDRNGAQDGEKVAAVLLRRGEHHADHRAKISAVFGPADSAAVCARAILSDYGIRSVFPDEVRAEANEIGSQSIREEELQNRTDLRDSMIFTIDGADTKDIDDAISLEKTQNGWVLGVHIADVSEYVTPGSALENEAFLRGTSVYYADQVIPMLPAELSNGICSLNPGEDRLAFSVLIELDRQGNRTNYRFFKSVIRSKLKGVYSEINEIFAKTESPQIREKYAQFLPTLGDMKDFAALLKDKRHARGALALESVETRIAFAEDGTVCALSPRESGLAEQMIEEFMLLANEAAAAFGIERNLPFLFRIHENPPEEKLEKLAELLKLLGMDATKIKPGVTPKVFSDILNKSKESDAGMLVNRQLLRSMAKAKYSQENLGHFGLVLAEYSHFTSPIRRYPDLLIHRIMSEFLRTENPAQITKQFGSFVKEAAEQSSTTEQRAANAERDCEDCYVAEYMHGHLGEEFDGVISGMTDHGIYVALSNTAEGMIRLSGLKGNLKFDGKIRMKDAASGVSYQIGDPVRVQVMRADVSSGEIDFSFAEQAL